MSRDILAKATTYFYTASGLKRVCKKVSKEDRTNGS